MGAVKVVIVVAQEYADHVPLVAVLGGGIGGTHFTLGIVVVVVVVTVLTSTTIIPDASIIVK